MAAPELKVLVAASTAAEPFTAAGLGEETGLERVFAGNKLFKWLNKGWVQRGGVGEFSRTKQFPKVAAPAKTED